MLSPQMMLSEDLDNIFTMGLVDLKLVAPLNKLILRPYLSSNARLSRFSFFFNLLPINVIFLCFPDIWDTKEIYTFIVLQPLLHSPHRTVLLLQIKRAVCLQQAGN